jgi:hypothetical protein
MQLSLCAEYLRSAGGIGFVAGDFNAISPRDSALALDSSMPGELRILIGMRVKERHGVKEMFPPGRLDRAAVLNLRPASVIVGREESWLEI